MIVHGLEDSLWLPQQACHLPDRHLKVHLREFEQPYSFEHRHINTGSFNEQRIAPYKIERSLTGTYIPLEKTRHSQARTPVSAVTRRTGVLSRDGDVGIHLPEIWRNVSNINIHRV